MDKLLPTVFRAGAVQGPVVLIKTTVLQTDNLLPITTKDDTKVVQCRISVHRDVSATLNGM